MVVVSWAVFIWLLVLFASVLYQFGWVAWMIVAGLLRHA
jgi:hypothetical protein